VNANTGFVVRELQRALSFLFHEFMNEKERCDVIPLRLGINSNAICDVCVRENLQNRLLFLSTHDSPTSLTSFELLG
jgi:hypothetical protein